MRGPREQGRGHRSAVVLVGHFHGCLLGQEGEGLRDVGRGRSRARGGYNSGGERRERGAGLAFVGDRGPAVLRRRPDRAWVGSCHFSFPFSFPDKREREERITLFVSSTLVPTFGLLIRPSCLFGVLDH